MSQLSILLTGSTGFVGGHVLSYLRQGYAVSAPTRAVLDLKDAVAVRRFLDQGQFDVVVHAANPTGHNPVDKMDHLFEDALKVFMSLEHCADRYGRLFYFGSGAEFGKHRSMDMVREEEFGQELPREPYGLSRFIMNRLASSRANITNLRLFGCYGPNDASHKLIPDLVRQFRSGREVCLRHNICFDFLYVEDIGPVLRHFIDKSPCFGDYNLCSGQPVRLMAIAEQVGRQLGLDVPIRITGQGGGLDYTASNDRLRGEIPNWRPTGLAEGLARMLTHE